MDTGMVCNMDSVYITYIKDFLQISVTKKTNNAF